MDNFLGSTEVVQGPVSSEMPSPEVGPVNPPSPQGPPGVLCVTRWQDIVDGIQPSYGVLYYDH